MHLNKVILIGVVGAQGPRLATDANGIQVCSFTLEIEQTAQSGKPFKVWIPVEVSGRNADRVSETLHARDGVLVDGRLTFRSLVDPKTGAKTSKMIVSTWTITHTTVSTSAA